MFLLSLAFLRFRDHCPAGPWATGGEGPVHVGDMFSQRQTSKLPQVLLSCLHGGSNAKTVPATRPSL